eukprot:TRINITY_DN4462_c0_g1_i1.p1 TRINITY_DN4462_c0_g1~~TRINITY_DN4462_c0_g1_i1.p1  ORF type:complete len:260 (+),score=51.60 TRINITY_DN4462_c0_g1_i1:79-780(+)
MRAGRLRAALNVARNVGASSQAIENGEQALARAQAAVDERRKVEKLQKNVSSASLRKGGASLGSTSMSLQRSTTSSRPRSAGSLSRQNSVPGKTSTQAFGSSSRPLSAGRLVRVTSLPMVSEDVSEESRMFRVGITERYCTLAETLAKMKKVKEDAGAHLKVFPIQMGARINYTSTYQSAVATPVAKANDPKWSTDLKNIDAKIGAKIKYENSLSAATPGSISPEMAYLPKPY